MPRLAKGGWAQIKLEGRKLLASTYLGQVLEDSYKLNGFVLIRVSTAKGNLDTTINLTLKLDDIPF